MTTADPRTAARAPVAIRETDVGQPVARHRAVPGNGAGVVVFDADSRLPEGIEVTIEPIGPLPGKTLAPEKTLAEQLGDLVGSVPDLPTDMAQQHDHYLHGSPKQ